MPYRPFKDSVGYLMSPLCTLVRDYIGKVHVDVAGLLEVVAQNLRVAKVDIF